MLGCSIALSTDALKDFKQQGNVYVGFLWRGHRIFPVHLGYHGVGEEQEVSALLCTACFILHSSIQFDIQQKCPFSLQLLCTKQWCTAWCKPICELNWQGYLPLRLPGLRVISTGI